jgi:hypothetical protein
MIWSIYLFVICAVVAALGKLWVYCAAFALLTMTSALSHSNGPAATDTSIFVADRIAITILVAIGGYYYIKFFRVFDVWLRIIPLAMFAIVCWIYFGSNMKWPEKFIAIHVATFIGHITIIYGLLRESLVSHISGEIPKRPFEVSERSRG